jgi:enolase
MSKLKKYITTNEASYSGNLGFEEMVKFYDKASDDEINKMEKFLKNDDWDGFKKLIKKVLGILLK